MQVKYWYCMIHKGAVDTFWNFDYITMNSKEYYKLFQIVNKLLQFISISFYV